MGKSDSRVICVANLLPSCAASTKDFVGIYECIRNRVATAEANMPKPICRDTPAPKIPVEPKFLSVDWRPSAISKSLLVNRYSMPPATERRLTIDEQGLLIVEVPDL